MSRSLRFIDPLLSLICHIDDGMQFRLNIIVFYLLSDAMILMSIVISPNTPNLLAENTLEGSEEMNGTI